MENSLYRLKKWWKNIVYRMLYWMFTTIRGVLSKSSVFLLADIRTACRGAGRYSGTYCETGNAAGFKYGNNLILDFKERIDTNTILLLYQDGKGHFRTSEENLDDFLCGVVELPQNQKAPIDWAETIRKEKWDDNTNLFAMGTVKVGELVLKMKQSKGSGPIGDMRNQPGVREDLEEARIRANKQEFRPGTE